jgi:hypothetical protein
LVAISPKTQLQKVIIYGNYSDELSLSYDGETMEVQINRFYKHPQVLERAQLYSKVRLIGFEHARS